MTMKHKEFDLENPLVCEGIIGDGCGGGRIFYVENATLFAYDSLTRESMVLLREIGDAKAISKKGCIITLVYAKDTKLFDLSRLKS